MKIRVKKTYKNYWVYNANNIWGYYTQKQYDYMCKYLDFEKLCKDELIFFNNKETKKTFYETYIDNRWLEDIYNNSPLGYEYLQNNWGKGVFRLYVFYPDKQELKTVVNRIINVGLRG